MNKKVAIILGILLYIASSGISYSFFSAKNKKNITPVSIVKPNGDIVQFDQTLPKTEGCPLNGAMYPKDQKDWWNKHRPLGIMIENHEEARPQSGLSRADVVYEAVAEGAITRFLAVFYCQDAGIVGPVRSARTYFLDWISEYGDYPIYTHVGAANCNGETGSGCQNGARADALGQIETYGWKSYNDINGIYLGLPYFYKDATRNKREVATEHTVFSKTGLLWKYGGEKGLTNVDEDGKAWDENYLSYSFKDDDPSKSKNQTIHLEFWEGYKQYFVDWVYDRTANLYKRNNGGKTHLDRNTNKQLAAKNIVVLSMVESNANDGYDNNLHLLYKNKGTGKASIFMDGKQINGTWQKDKRTSKTLLYDSEGTPVKFNRGLIWFEILPTTGVLKVQ